MSLPQWERSHLAFGATLAACLGALILSTRQVQEINTYSSVPTLTSAGSLKVQSFPIVRPSGNQFVNSAVQPLPAHDEGIEEFVVVKAASTVQSMGLSALSMSLVLAVTGLALRVYAYLQPKQTSALSALELVVHLEDGYSMAAAAAKKGSKTKVKKAPKVKKEDKPEREPVILTPKEVFARMRQGVLRRAKKPTKTTGRVCQILGKIDNRKARSISFSHRRTKRLQMVNLHWRRMWWEEGKCFVMLRLSTKGIKTVTRYGLHQAAIKFGLDLTKHINGTSERKYIKYLPEKDKKLAMIRGAKLRYRSAVRWAKLNDQEPPPPLLSRKAPAKEPAEIAMAISHGCKMAKLGKPADQRKALLRSLTTEIIRHGRIKTTLIRAKAVRKYVEHIITLAKTGTLHTRRQALGYVYDKDLVRTLFDQVPERYGERAGGYTRIIRTLPRRGDAAKMCYIELV